MPLNMSNCFIRKWYNLKRKQRKRPERLLSKNPKRRKKERVNRRASRKRRSDDVIVRTVL